MTSRAREAPGVPSRRKSERPLSAWRQARRVLHAGSAQAGTFSLLLCASNPNHLYLVMRVIQAGIRQKHLTKIGSAKSVQPARHPQRREEMTGVHGIPGAGVSDKSRTFFLSHWNPDSDANTGSPDGEYGTPTSTHRPVSGHSPRPLFKRKAQCTHHRTSFIFAFHLSQTMSSLHHPSHEV